MKRTSMQLCVRISGIAAAAWAMLASGLHVAGAAHDAPPEHGAGARGCLQRSLVDGKSAPGRGVMGPRGMEGRGGDLAALDESVRAVQRAARAIATPVMAELRPWWDANREANKACRERSERFVGGFYGSFGGENAICIPKGESRNPGEEIGISYVATQMEIDRHEGGFGDLTQVEWARAARVAQAVCSSAGHTAGFFTGEQEPGKSYSLVCKSGRARRVSVRRSDLRQDLGDLNTVDWWTSMQVAADYCESKWALFTGFFNGIQTQDSYEIICVPYNK
ncbi:hypothetical protein WME99_47835 [Sorangium sp. So ce136]|uniref:hypothetical protein n=1 Tax=Sorangium sp. So ce136 TaxID=3133284 RepID=UPI003F0774BB